MSRVSQPHVRFTYDEFVRLVESDVLGTTRVELLNGRMYFMTPGGRHMAAMSNATEAFNRAKAPRDWVIFQGTLRLDRRSAPDPDVLWLPVPKNTPEHLWPDPVLLVEVSDTTYRKDAGVKLRKYAYHRVPEYWIENLAADRIEVYREPQNPTGRPRDCGYASVQHYGRGQHIPVSARPGVTLAVDELLPLTGRPASLHPLIRVDDHLVDHRPPELHAGARRVLGLLDLVVAVDDRRLGLRCGLWRGLGGGRLGDVGLHGLLHVAQSGGRASRARSRGLSFWAADSPWWAS
jgi:Uma2 family endonuclease